MRKLFIAAFAIMLPLAAGAQTVSDLETDFRARTSVAVDWKVSRGFHISLEGEARMKDNCTGLDRFQTTLGVSYKITPWLKAGLGYTFMEKQGTASLKPRHRVSADLTGSWKAGFWTFSLRERFMLTNRPDGNNMYEHPRNALALKSRFQVKYKINNYLKPYALLEVRTALNDAQFTGTYNSTTGKYGIRTDSSGNPIVTEPSYVIVNNNRYRAGLGLDWKISKHHSLDIYGLADYCRERDINFNSDATKLNSFTIDRALNITAGLGYVFSF